MATLRELFWLHYPGYILARVFRLLRLLTAAIFPRWRKTRLAEGDAERAFIATFESLTVPEVGGQGTKVGN